jgi:hypothetical protein
MKHQRHQSLMFARLFLSSACSQPRVISLMVRKTNVLLSVTMGNNRDCLLSLHYVPLCWTLTSYCSLLFPHVLLFFVVHNGLCCAICFVCKNAFSRPDRTPTKPSYKSRLFRRLDHISHYQRSETDQNGILLSSRQIAKNAFIPVW